MSVFVRAYTRYEFQLCVYRLLCVNECVFNYICDFMLTVPSVECVPYSVLQVSKCVSYFVCIPMWLLHCCIELPVACANICIQYAIVLRVSIVFKMWLIYVLFFVRVYHMLCLWYSCIHIKYSKFETRLSTLWPSGTVPRGSKGWADVRSLFLLKFGPMGRGLIRWYTKRTYLILLQL